MTTMTTPTVNETTPTPGSTRRTAVLVGVLFLAATGTFLVADELITGVLDLPDFLTSAPAHATALSAGALLAFVDGLAVVGIALLLYPLLERYSQPLALGYVGFRIAELAAILLYLATPLLVSQIGGGLADGTVDAAAGQHLGAVFQAQYDVAIVMIYLFTSVAGTVLAVALHRSRLIPRPLAVLGLAGYPVLLVGTVLHVFDLADVTQGAGLLAVAPGGLFELILPIWLIVSGFSRPLRLGKGTA
ncbi:DUF4386 domain-containing protein [Egibacter rhizosphaerae]|uniref:DUF4386 domain-containing protein n=1 Tax=Egibacter rhizosphaerae TaxID=1670831 RepID=A0A411YBF5_9ACTN|nr:DUF4386 domain-containing protein [Egibacter rhizosphaerae]QBI18502.1 DUF4386 domain-containing protein [Egibacter rhizosphaerae]